MPRFELRRPSFSILLCSLLACGLSACDAPSTAPAADPASGSIVEGGDPPALQGTTADGDAIDLAALSGQVVIVDFWASWCTPCKEELPELEQLYADLAASGLVIIGVSVDESTEDMQSFLNTMPLSFPVVFDEGGTIAKAWDPPKMPTSYIIGPDGKIAHIQLGYKASDAQLIRDRVSALLGT